MMSDPKVNLNQLSLDELKQLQNDVAIAIYEYEERRKEEAKAAITAKANEFGFSLEEVLSSGKGKTKSKPRKVAAKYVDPTDPNRTWTGRGRKPKWVEAYLAQGKSMEDLKI
jgi:DNA-binding protein H-NS